MNINNLIKSAFVKNYKIKLVAYLGLTISFTALLFGVSFYRVETSYDTFHNNADRLYRLTLKPETGLEDAQIGYVPREQFLAEIPEIENVVRLHQYDRPVIICKNQMFTKESVFSVDSSFFNVFSFSLKRGNYRTLYEKPNSIILTSEFAARLFGNDNVIGQTLKLTETDISVAELYTVIGIVQDFPANSHITAGAFTFNPRIEYEFYTYLLLQKNIDTKKVEKKLDDIYKKPNIATLQNIKDIHLHSNKDHEIIKNGSISSLRIVVISCILLFIISLCNYIIISLITNIRGVKTIQLKRIVGARFSILIIEEIAAQIIVILPVIAIGTLIFSSINYINIFINKDAIQDLIMLTVAFAVAAIISACIPFGRLYFKLQKTNIVQQSNSSTIQVLAIFQIAIAIGLIAANVSVTRQLNFINRNQLGGTETNLLVINNLTWDQMKICEQLKQELLKHPCVLGICSAAGTPGNGIKEGRNLRKNGEEVINLNILEADHNFVEFFNIPLIAGNYLPEYNYSKDWEESHFDPHRAVGPSPGIDYYLVNRKALKALGFTNPQDALGTSLGSDLFTDGRIVGVVEDFHFGSIYEKEVPLLIKQRNWKPSTMIIRYQKKEEQAVIKLLKQQWNIQMPNSPFKYTFMTDIYNNIYRNEKYTFHLILLISLLCISLSVLGLISITAYTTNQRTKEIGIRRVNGSQAAEILFLLNKDIVKWVAIAFIIACPIVYYTMAKWLENFAYKTELSWWIFVLAGMLTLFIALITVSWQAWHTASRNPVEALRSE